jgi:hypothetical protein
MESIKRRTVVIALAALTLSEPVVEFTCGQIEGSPGGWRADFSQSSRVCQSLAERIFPHTHADEVDGEVVATFAQPMAVTGNVTAGITYVRLAADIRA